MKSYFATANLPNATVANMLFNCINNYIPEIKFSHTLYIIYVKIDERKLQNENIPVNRRRNVELTELLQPVEYLWCPESVLSG